MSDIQKLHKGIKLETKDVFYLLVWAVLFYFTWLFMHGADRFLDLTPQSLGKYFKSVSYTHLDVYKRQVQVVYAVMSLHSAVLNSVAHLNSCLLYTSRCV